MATTRPILRLTLGALLCLALVTLAAGLAPVVRSAPALAADPADFQLSPSGRIEGQVLVLDVEDGIMVIGGRFSLTFYDVSVPSQPRVLSALTIPDYALSIQLEDGMAYLSWGGCQQNGGGCGAGFDVYDLASPTAPLRLSRTPVAQPLQKLTVFGDTAYAGIFLDKTFRIDLRDPFAPQIRAYQSAAFAGYHQLERVVERADLGGRRFAYISGNSGNAQYNVVDLATEAVVSTILSGPTAEVTTDDGRHLVYTLTENGVIITDLTDPAKPVARVTVALPGLERLIDVGGLRGDDIFLGDGLLYAITGVGLYTLDLANPLAPRVAQPMDDPPVPTGYVEGDLLLKDGLIVATTRHIVLYELTDPALPRKVAEIANGYTTWAYANQHLFSGDSRGLVAVDIRRPAAPQLRPTSYESIFIRNQVMVTAGDTLLLGDDNWHLLDVADPAQPRKLSSLSLPGSTITAELDMAGASPRAYLLNSCLPPYWGCAANLPQELSVYDLADLAQPRRLGGINFADGEFDTNDRLFPVDFAVSGGYAYVVFQVESGFHWELVTVDLRDLAKPRVVSRQLFDGAVRDIVIDSGRAYVAGWDLRAFSLADPVSPKLLSTYPRRGNSVVADGAAVFMSMDTTGVLHTLDYSDPASPRLVETIQLPEPNGRLFFADDMLVAAGHVNYGGGIMIYQRGPSTKGTVRDARGAPMTNVSLQLSGATGLELSAALPSFMATDLSGAVQVDRAAAAGATLTPSFRGAAFAPASRSVDANTVLDFTLLAPPVTAAVAPGTATTLTLTDTQGLVSSLSLPAGALSAPSALTLRPQVAANTWPLRFAGQSFTLSLGAAGARFVQPAQLTLRYSRADVRMVSDLGQLALYRRDGASWVRADAGCAGASAPSNNQAAHELRVAICAAGEYALLGPTVRLSLPLLSR